MSTSTDDPAVGGAAPRPRGGRLPFSESFEEMRRALDEFLALPTGIMAGFIVLAALTYVLDTDAVVALRPVRQAMQQIVFTTPEATAQLLGVIASGLITVSALTFSLVLLAVQQAAGSLTFSVIAQFLRRRTNQVAFGFFAGLALYALIVLATTTPAHSPVLGGALALLLTAVSLYLLLLLLYTTVNQMQPEEIARAIHDHILAARRHQLDIVRRTRRTASLSDDATRMRIYVDHHGFLINVDVDRLEAAALAVGGETEIVLLHSIGQFVAYGDPLAEIRGGPTGADAESQKKKLNDAVCASLRLERRRKLNEDPAYGIEQLANIAWTSISTSKSSPAPGIQMIRVLRDVLARWAAGEMQTSAAPDAPDAPASPAEGRRVAPVVYTDNTHDRLMDTLESLAVVSTESMQHQSFTEVLHAITTTYDRLPAALQRRAEDLVRRALTGLGDHVLTADIDEALTDLTRTLTAAGRSETAHAVQTAQTAMRAEVGTLRSRSNRGSAGD